MLVGVDATDCPVRFVVKSFSLGFVHLRVLSTGGSKCVLLQEAGLLLA